MAQEQQAKVDKPERESGRNPDYPRRWRVDLLSKEEIARLAAERAARRSPLEQMQAAVAALADTS